MRFLKLALIVAALMGFSDISYARKMIAPTGQQNCSMVETATVGINFSNVPIDINSAKSYTQEKADEVMALAADLGIEDITLQNLNYNVYSNYSGGCQGGATQIGQYTLSGGISFQVNSGAEKAAMLMEAIGEKGYNVNFNMNAYRQCQ